MVFFLLAGQPRPSEAIHPAEDLNGIELTMTRNLHLFQGKSYLCFQTGVSRWLSDSNPDILIVEANPRYLSTPPADPLDACPATPGDRLGVGSLQGVACNPDCVPGSSISSIP